MPGRHFSAQPQPLTGWGLHPVTPSFVASPKESGALSEILEESKDNALVGRGLGRSYGDAALNENGHIVRMDGLNRIIDFNEQTGRLRCEPGLSLDEIITRFRPKGWFPSVTPGTKFVTVGGAIAFDVHGKNHHIDGNFCNFVHEFKLLLASGETIACSRTENADAYWATVSGMGLTGMITEVELSLRSIPTAYIKGHNIKAKNLDTAFALFQEHEPNYQYSVAWIDCLASGGSVGRSILMFGNHAQASDLSPKQAADPLNLPKKPRLKVPFHAPSSLLNSWSIRAFNTLYYYKQISPETRGVASYESFFYPLDFLERWNLLYGRRGFVQYQCVFPPEVSREGLVKMLGMCSAEGWGSFLAVLKRFGPQEGWLTFPLPGYTLALDIQIRPGLWEFLDKLDRLVLDHGGRVYLAKDCRLSAEAFREMYPAFPKWLETKAKLDPKNRFSSDLSRRLKIEY